MKETNIWRTVRELTVVTLLASGCSQVNALLGGKQETAIPSLTAVAPTAPPTESPIPTPLPLPTEVTVTAKSVVTPN